MSCNNNSTRLPISPILTPTAGPQGSKGDLGDTGPKGDAGDSSYTYIAYASDDIGTGFTTTFNSALNYIGIITSTTPLTPVSSDFNGKWFNYKGATGATGAPGTPGISDVSRLLYSSAGTLSISNSTADLDTFTIDADILSTNGDNIEIECTFFATTPVAGVTKVGQIGLNSNYYGGFGDNLENIDKYHIRMIITRQSATTIGYWFESEIFAKGAGFLHYRLFGQAEGVAVLNLTTNTNTIKFQAGTTSAGTTMSLRNRFIKLNKF